MENGFPAPMTMLWHTEEVNGSSDLYLKCSDQTIENFCVIEFSLTAILIGFLDLKKRVSDVSILWRIISL